MRARIRPRAGALVGLGEHGQVSGGPCCAALLASLPAVPPSFILDSLPDPYLLQPPPCHFLAGASGRPELLHAYHTLAGRRREGLASETRPSVKRILLPTCHVHPWVPPLTSGPSSLYPPSSVWRRQLTLGLVQVLTLPPREVPALPWLRLPPLPAPSCSPWASVAPLTPSPPSLLSPGETPCTGPRASDPAGVLLAPLLAWPHVPLPPPRFSCLSLVSRLQTLGFQGINRAGGSELPCQPDVGCRITTEAALTPLCPTCRSAPSTVSAASGGRDPASTGPPRKKRLHNPGPHGSAGTVAWDACPLTPGNRAHVLQPNRALSGLPVPLFPTALLPTAGRGLSL